MWGQDSLRPSQSDSDFGELATAGVAVYNAGSMSRPVAHERDRVGRDARAGFSSYETIQFDGRLEIGEGGRVAWFSRRQLIRFLEDDARVFLDRVWGDGVLFAGYETGPTRIIDAIPARRGYVVLLRLPRRIRKGETFEIVTGRKIVGAFADEDAYWELAMSAPTASLSLQVSSRRARGMRTIHVAAPRLRGVDVRQRRRSLGLKVDSPALYVPYRLEWRWN